MTDQLCLDRPVELGALPAFEPEAMRIGVDVSLHVEGATPDEVATLLLPLAGDFRLDSISSWGREVWPVRVEAFVAGCWRCRFTTRHGETTTDRVDALRDRLTQAGVALLRVDHVVVTR